MPEGNHQAQKPAELNSTPHDTARGGRSVEIGKLSLPIPYGINLCGDKGYVFRFLMARPSTVLSFSLFSTDNRNRGKEERKEEKERKEKVQDR